MPRFVILEHDWPFPHWDLMLESGDALLTWRLYAEPDAGRTVDAEPLADHRLVYLDYEGPVSGNRGNVSRWDAGDYRLVEDTQSAVTVQLNGVRLTGSAAIRSRGSGRWQFTLTAAN